MATEQEEEQKEEKEQQAPIIGAEPSKSPDKLSFLQIAGSTVAAAFGVQSKRNRERDFNQGKPVHFIVAGIVFTAVFVVGMVVLVNVVLSNV